MMEFITIGLAGIGPVNIVSVHEHRSEVLILVDRHFVTEASAVEIALRDYAEIPEYLFECATREERTYVRYGYRSGLVGVVTRHCGKGLQLIKHYYPSWFG